MASKQRAWFFNSEAGKTGSRFNKGNIPTIETMSYLLDSVPLFAESSDQGTETRQGLFKVYTDDDAINAYAGGTIPKGSRKVLKSSQMPSICVIDSNGDIHEAVPTDADNDGAPVSGGGLKLTSKIITSGNYKRMSTYITLDPYSLPEWSYTAERVISLIVYDHATGKTYRAEMSSLVIGSSQRFKITMDVNQGVDTAIVHNIGKAAVRAIYTDGSGYIQDLLVKNSVDLNSTLVRSSVDLKTTEITLIF